MTNLATVNDELGAAFGDVQDDINLDIYELNDVYVDVTAFDYIEPPRITWRDDFRRVLWCAA